MSNNELNLEEIMQQVSELLDRCKAKSDSQLWTLACVMVALAGGRAQETNRPEIEQACIDFVEAMHEYAGTPALEETAQ